ncbi:MAG: helix-turn-helix domain-containing protein [Erysipelotrichia bacterium]|jgi:predicted nucleotidyltransferase|nr:helix-turn-helix domain-containing protein [Erysipelotrichia bacterium]
MNIKERRAKLNITQAELSKLTGLSTRTIRRYELGNVSKIKEQYILRLMDEYFKIDEEHGILKQDDIVSNVTELAKSYDISLVYLFGSYAKGNASELSDVDLLIDTKEKGLRYFGLIEELRETLKKKIDIIRIEDLLENSELLTSILRDGIKIYG